MKFSYSIDPEKRVIFQRFEGRFAFKHVMPCVNRLWADPAYDKTFGVYVDLTRATPESGFDDLNALIDFLRDRPETSEGRCAIVTSSPVLTACGLIYQKAMARRHAFAVFSTPEAARTYLQIEAAPPDWGTQAVVEEIAS